MGSASSKDPSFWSTLRQAFPPKSKFSVDQIPDLSGQVILVTGTFLTSVALNMTV